MKPHSIKRAAALLTDKERLEADILKLRSAQYEGRIWDSTIGAYAFCADLYFAGTSDERIAEILRSGLIADKEKAIAEIDAEYADLQRAEPLIAPIKPATEQEEAAA